MTMRKFWTLVAPLACFLAGCQAGGPAPVSQAPVAAPAAPASLSPAAKRRLMAAPASSARLWGLQHRHAWLELEYLSHDRFSSYRRAKESRHLGIRFIDQTRGAQRYAALELGFKADYTFAGEGGSGALVHLDRARYLYTVPAGRVLILNRAEFPERIAVNGFPLRVTSSSYAPAVETLDYVFGPGEQVLFSFPFNEDGPARPTAAISGMTIDPAILGGSLPAASGGASK